MDPLLLRFLERLTVVLIGGMAIYLGFRLFVEVPEQRDSSGKVVLPWDISIIMTRIGPGVFFALFGTLSVGLSLIRPLEINLYGEGSPSVRYIADQKLGSDDRGDERALLRKEIARLNTIPRLLREDLADYERDAIERSIARAKLLLMKPVWGNSKEGFGDYTTFERWVDESEPAPPPVGMDGALDLYRYGTMESTP